MTRFVLESASGGPLSARRVARDAHWTWLAEGWRDFKAGWRASIWIGVAVTLVSIGIVFGLLQAGLGVAIPAACGGFALAGPILAASLYGVSRRLDQGEEITGPGALKFEAAAPGQVALIGFALFLLLFVWGRLATLLYAMASGTLTLMPHEDFIQFALQTPQGLVMLLVGSLIGGALALTGFAISAISIPMVVDRQVDAMTAMVVSCQAVLRNRMATLSWAFVISILIAISVATGFLALVVVFPWMGHVTWRAYRALAGGRVQG